MLCKNKKLLSILKKTKSKQGFQTAVWGPPMWFTLHIISFNYPLKPSKEDKKNYKSFFDSLDNILPCKACRENLRENKKNTNYGMHVFKNRRSLSYWVYQLHEEVNKLLGKESKLKYEDIVPMYEILRAKCKTMKKTHEGCIDPTLYGTKSYCNLMIMPRKHSLKKAKLFGKSKDTINMSPYCFQKNKK